MRVRGKKLTAGFPFRPSPTALSLGLAAAAVLMGLVAAGHYLFSDTDNDQADAAISALDSASPADARRSEKDFSFDGLAFGAAENKGEADKTENAEVAENDRRQAHSRASDPGSVEAYIAESDNRGIHIGKAGRSPKATSRIDDPLAPYNNDEEADEEPDTAAEDESLFDEVMVEEALYARNGSISGRVVNESGMPMVGVGVTATAIHLFDIPPNAEIPVGDLQRHAVSDTAGRYYFEQLVPGEYRVHNVPTADYGMSQIAVRTGVDFADIALKTQHSVTVSGWVTDTLGQPLAGVLVKPMILGEAGGYTDSDGQFTLQLQIQTDARSLGIGATLLGYRDKMTLIGTQDFNLQKAAAVSIQLEPIENRSFVTGVVIDAKSGAPVGGKSVSLTSADQSERYSATTGPDGRFTMPAVATGDGYELLITGGGGYEVYLQPNVSVTTQGLELAVMLAHEEPSTLAGRMVGLDGTPIANFSMVVRAARPPYQAMRVTSDATGNFLIQNPPKGALVFESQSDPRMLVGGVEVTNTGQDQVTLKLDIGRDEIFGTLVDSEGQPVSAPNVVLSWRHSYDGINSSSTRRSSADSNGQFSFRGIGPGTRTVIVDVGGYKPARVNHDAATQGYEVVIELEAEATS